MVPIGAIAARSLAFSPPMWPSPSPIRSWAPLLKTDLRKILWDPLIWRRVEHRSHRPHRTCPDLLAWIFTKERIPGRGVARLGGAPETACGAEDSSILWDQRQNRAVLSVVLPLMSLSP